MSPGIRPRHDPAPKAFPDKRRVKLGTACALVPLIIAVACGATPVRAQPRGVPQRVFACSLGRKSVTVTAAGSKLIYSFGTPAHTELQVVASAKRGNVFYRWDIYDSPEQQLRFVAGPYSYIRRVVDMPCSPDAEFGAGFDYSTLPEDTESNSAMAL